MQRTCATIVITDEEKQKWRPNASIKIGPITAVGCVKTAIFKSTMWIINRVKNQSLNTVSSQVRDRDCSENTNFANFKIKM